MDCLQWIWYEHVCEAMNVLRSVVVAVRRGIWEVCLVKVVRLVQVSIV